MTREGPEALRDRTRRAVRDEITLAAMALFLRQGYDTTTTADIAAAAGISTRSLFRYFATKEDIVIGKIDLGTRPLLATLRARPAQEPAWTAMVEAMKSAYAAPATPHDSALLRMVFETPALMSVYLRRARDVQQEAAAVLDERARHTARSCPESALISRVVATAAFGCLLAAQQAAVDSPGSEDLPSALERSLAALSTAVTS